MMLAPTRRRFNGSLAPLLEWLRDDFGHAKVAQHDLESWTLYGGICASQYDGDARLDRHDDELRLCGQIKLFVQYFS